ncbi:MAG: TonB-dependent receptor [Saprospiraceae bacterium]
MKKILYAFLFVVFALVSTQAQNSIKGSVIDTTTAPLPSATVMILNKADSSLVSFALTDGQGAFKVQRVPSGEYLLRISYVGYANNDQPIAFNEGKEDRDVGVIELLPESALIDEITVVGERNPIELKKDTIEFNAGSFQTQPNAVVEDLLGQLPGVEIERDGSVTAQGEDVQRVLVDGKEFFGRDPKIATKNLPADAVEKVQVFDQKSDQAQFTGVDDGVREKTINLTLKEDKKKGAFGNVTAGYGDAGRFVGRGNVNSFNKNTKLSLIGTANNINEQGFSQSDYSSFNNATGRGGRRGGSQGIPGSSNNSEGIATTFAGGLNLNHEFTEETEINLSYFISSFDKLTTVDQFQQNFLSNETGLITDDFSNQDDLNTNHSLNLRFSSDLDSLSSLLIRGDFVYNLTESLGSYNSFTSDFEDMPRNSSDQITNNEGDILRGNGSALYRRKFAKPGRNMSVNLSYGLNNTDFLGNTTSSNIFFNSRDGVVTPVEQNLNQDQDQLNEANNYSAQFSFTEPLGKRRYIEFNYRYSENLTDLDRAVYDIDSGERIFNDQLSNLYRTGYTYNNAGLNFVVNRPSYNLTIGATYQNSVLDGELLLADTKINQTLNNILPKLNYRYNFSSGKNLNIDYSTNVIEPTITQLQPFVDNSNPLNIYQGNPNLRPEYRHNIRTRLIAFNPSTFSGVFAFLNFTYATNKIRNNQIFDDNGVRTTIPVNVDNDYQTTFTLSYSSRLNKLGLSYRIRPNVRYSRGIAFVNGIENNTDNVTTGMRVSFDNLKRDKVDIGVGGDFSYTTAQFSIADAQNQNFINHTYFADLTVTLVKDKLNVRSKFDYSIYNGLSDDFNQEIPIWNAEVSLFMLKGNKGQLKVGVFDILNQNRGVSRINQLNFITDRTVNALGRYFLTTFTYSLKGFDSNAGRRPGGRR